VHAIHHTDAFIVKQQPSGEANSRVWLFTELFGLVVASVQGVRKAGAKLAMHTTEYGFVSVDLVRGKEVWRLISAREIEHPFMGKDTTALGRAYVRVLGVVERFCQGEEPHPELFSHLKECLSAFRVQTLDVRLLDTIALWKVMVLLGYIAVSKEDEHFFSLPLLEAVSRLDEATAKRLIAQTNDAITQTHL
jgi:recombinational DNA repair protein (RecF pathway)